MRRDSSTGSVSPPEVLSACASVSDLAALLFFFFFFWVCHALFELTWFPGFNASPDVGKVPLVLGPNAFSCTCTAPSPLSRGDPDFAVITGELLVDRYPSTRGEGVRTSSTEESWRSNGHAPLADFLDMPTLVNPPDSLLEAACWLSSVSIVECRRGKSPFTRSLEPML